MAKLTEAPASVKARENPPIAENRQPTLGRPAARPTPPIALSLESASRLIRSIYPPPPAPHRDRLLNALYAYSQVHTRKTSHQPRIENAFGNHSLVANPI